LKYKRDKDNKRETREKEKGKKGKRGRVRGWGEEREYSEIR